MKVPPKKSSICKYFCLIICGIILSLILNVAYKSGLLTTFNEVGIGLTCRKSTVKIPGPEDIVQYNRDILIVGSYELLAAQY